MDNEKTLNLDNNEEICSSDHNYDAFLDYRIDFSHKLLTRNEEKKLFNIMRRNGKKSPRYYVAREKIIMSNQRLVAKRAHVFLKKYNDVPIGDLIGHGNEGLINAVDRFNIRRENKFSTFAFYYIDGYIYKYLSRHHIICIPPNMRATMGRLKISKDMSSSEISQCFKDNKIGKRLRERIEQCKISVISMEEPLAGSDDILLKDTIAGNIGFQNYDKESILTLSDIILDLNKEEKTLIKNLYYENKTLKEIGKTMGVTSEAVRLRKVIVLKKMLRKISRDKETPEYN